MNDLIGRGLVFRLRYQEPTGRWRTRTYVCSSPVTLAELRDIQTQYSRCMIETSGELTQALNSQPTPAKVHDLTGLRASTLSDPGSGHAPVAADPACVQSSTVEVPLLRSGQRAVDAAASCPILEGDFLTLGRCSESWRNLLRAIVFRLELGGAGSGCSDP